LFIIASLIALPFITVDVSVRSQGVIKSVTDRNKLTSLVSGKIEKLYIRENKPIRKGDRVAVIATPLLQEKIHFNIKRQQKVDRYLKDLVKLQQLDSTSVMQSIHLNTPKYRQSLAKFRQQSRGNMQGVQK